MVFNPTFPNNLAIKSIQSVNSNITNGNTTNNNTITAVDTDNTFIIAKQRTSAASENPDEKYMTFSLTSSTNIQLRRIDTTGDTDTAQVFIVEFMPGIIASIQNFETVLTTASGTQAITAVNTDNSFIISRGHRSATVTSGGEEYDTTDYTFNSSTEVLVERTNAANADNQTFAFTVVEFIAKAS